MTSSLYVADVDAQCVRDEKTGTWMVVCHCMAVVYGLEHRPDLRQSSDGQTRIELVLQSDAVPCHHWQRVVD